MLAYKVAEHKDILVILTLEIPEDAVTNINRSNVVVKETAKHRANKVKVLKIEDAKGNTYRIANSCCYDKNKIYYVSGELIEEPSFDPNLEKVCAAGIHFFLTRRLAELCLLKDNENGLYET